MLRRSFPLAAALLLAACGAGSDAADGIADNASPVATVAPADAQSGATLASDVPIALQTTAPLIGGGEIELDAYAGRPVLLWFWAPW